MLYDSDDGPNTHAHTLGPTTQERRRLGRSESEVVTGTGQVKTIVTNSPQVSKYLESYSM